MRETSSDVVAAVQRTATDLAGAVAGTSWGWLVLGVLLHLANQGLRDGLQADHDVLQRGRRRSSLHVGFAFAVGIAVAAAARHRAVKAIALVWGPLIGLAVMATGNHFVFDIAAGLVASAAGYGLGVIASRTADWSWRPVPQGRTALGSW